MNYTAIIYSLLTVLTMGLGLDWLLVRRQLKAGTQESVAGTSGAKPTDVALPRAAEDPRAPQQDTARTENIIEALAERPDPSNALTIFIANAVTEISSEKTASSARLIAFLSEKLEMEGFRVTTPLPSALIPDIGQAAFQLSWRQLFYSDALLVITSSLGGIGPRFSFQGAFSSYTPSLFLSTVQTALQLQGRWEDQWTHREEVLTSPEDATQEALDWLHRNLATLVARRATRLRYSAELEPLRRRLFDRLSSVDDLFIESQGWSVARTRFLVSDPIALASAPMYEVDELRRLLFGDTQSELVREGGFFASRLGASELSALASAAAIRHWTLDDATFIVEMYSQGETPVVAKRSLTTPDDWIRFADSVLKGDPPKS